MDDDTPASPSSPSSSSLLCSPAHCTTRPQLDFNKISSALSLTPQFPMRGNWTHLERAWITDHSTKKYLTAIWTKKAEIKGINSWGERGQRTQVPEHATTPHAELNSSVNEPHEISGTDCSFTAVGWRVGPRPACAWKIEAFKHVWAAIASSPADQVASTLRSFSSCALSPPATGQPSLLLEQNAQQHAEQMWETRPWLSVLLE